MLPQQQTPLVLTAMTIRGIGSYLRGARLELQPLTLLCGKNGSGKSTWLKVLNLLRRSLDANTLPWSFHVSDQTSDNIQVTNAFYQMGFGWASDLHSLLADPEADREFGPPGTIGLELRASRDIDLEPTKDGNDEACGSAGRAKEFLWSGRCRGGTRIRVRISHPTYMEGISPDQGLCDLVELEIDGGFVVRMLGDVEAVKDSKKSRRRPQRSRTYQLSCSEAFLTELTA